MADATRAPAPDSKPRLTPARGRPKSINPFRALQVHRNFRLFWTGQTVSLIGTWMQTVGQGWLALELTNSAFLVGVVSAAGSFPVLLLSLYGGVVADRYSKLRIVIICQALLLAEAAALWWFTWSGHIGIGSLLALTTLNGVISAFEIPARQAMIVELVSREDLVDAIALNSGGFNLARIIGPSIAAVVLAKWGVATCFGVNAVSYLAVLASLGMVKLPRWSPVVNLVSPFEQLQEGFRYIRGSRAVSGLMGVVAVYSIFGFQYLSMMPVIARDVLHTGAGGYGLLLTFVGIGALTGALSLAGLGVRIKRGRLYNVTAYAYAGLIMLFSLTRTLHLGATVLLFLGLAMLINGALSNGIIQSVVPDELRGRVIATYIFVYVGFPPIGSFLAGLLANYIGVEWAIFSGGAVMLVYALWAFWKYPEVRSV
ncbi:MAG TPA: MFS transporter [Gemmatimonadaceae bacterium]|jgi:MFS family permease|nr:MFS transporter [Gemmatimonadaceae bacterium]